ncbi:MAG TPA: folylpolyglutamate synthase/dihydrofolate synthase family protein [Kiritimatiellia bacterium]|nr:folylpolyglutamate synthase/dihydrofolate synthase family protein [Kiritimatiellia bacterium]
MSANPQRPLDDVLACLYTRNLHVIKLGLDTELALLDALDRPHDHFLAIHVAGTNGKGSVCAMLAEILRAAGFRTGLYTSPHLCRFNERLRVDGVAISDEELGAALATVEEAAARVCAAGARDATFFEFTTALAFHWFRARGVQVAVLETGMGGRLDATNVVTPVLSVITSIGLDHQAFLGDTIEKIATEKAGIIKANRPVVLGQLPESADAVMRETAARLRAPLRRAADLCSVTRTAQSLDGQRMRIETGDESISRVACPLLGRHQLGNIAVAVAAIQVFTEATGLPIHAESIRAGLAAVRWPARIQVLSREPDILLDGAHNPEAMHALRQTVEELRGKRPVALLASFLADKDAARCLRAWDGLLDQCWLVPLDNARAMDEATLREAALQADLRCEMLPLEQALDAGRRWAEQRGGLLVIAGSLYLAGEVLIHLNQAP